VGSKFGPPKFWCGAPYVPQKPLNRSSPKFPWVITSGTPTPRKILSRYDYPSCLPPKNGRKCASSDSASVSRSSFSLQPRPLHRFSRSVHQMTWFLARMCILGVPKKFLHFDPFPSPRKTQIYRQFSTRQKMSRQNSLNIKDVHL